MSEVSIFWVIWGNVDYTQEAPDYWELDVHFTQVWSEPC